MKHYFFTIVIEKDKDGYFVSCPELQGCYTQGDTYEQAVENIKDAIRLHLEEIFAEQKDFTPHTQSVALSTVEVAV